jgi:hypothetical protein
MATLEYHIDPRGTPGYTVTYVGTVQNYRMVIPAVAIVDSAGVAAGAGTQASPTITQETGTGYKTVAASQTNQVLGTTTGAIGDTLQGFEIVPATTSPGAVTFKDGAGASITAFVGGTVSDLKAWSFALGAKSIAGGWSVTTGANVSVIAVGTFT